VQRITAILAVGLGLGLIVFTLATSLYSRTAAAERITDQFRQGVSAAGLAQTRADYDLIARGRGEFVKAVVPALAQQLKLGQPAFTAFVASTFPTIPAAVATFPTIDSFVGPFVGQLQRNREKFESVDSLPLLGLPIDATPWLLAALGAAIALAGAVSLVRRGRAPTFAILGLGIVAIAVPLAASIPSKASDARDMSDLGNQVLNQRAATFAATTTDKVDALVEQVTTEMIPAVAKRLDTTPAAFSATLARDFPATTNLLGVWPARLSKKAHAFATDMQAYTDEMQKVDKIPFGALAWVVIGPGIVLLLAAAFTRGAGAAGRARPERTRPPAGVG
jgi:hypothetical protein